MKKLAWVFIVVAVCAWMFFVIWSASSFQECIAKQENQETAANIEKHPPKISVSRVIYARIDTFCAGQWAYASRDALTAIATVFIALFTLTLWRSTENMWKEAKASGITANIAANAAMKSAEIADKSLSIAQRAFVFGKGFSSGIHFWENKLKEYIFWVEWENVGMTPAADVQSWINVQSFPIMENREPDFIKSNQTGSSSVLGPHAKGQSSYQTIPLATMIECWNNQTEIFIWARVEYRDIFDSTIIHHHEQCARIELMHEPSVAPPENHPSYVQFHVYGPQNSTG